MRPGPVKQAGHPGWERLSSLEFNNTVSHHENIVKYKLWVNFSWAKKLSWLPEHPLRTRDGNSMQPQALKSVTHFQWHGPRSCVPTQRQGLELTISNQCSSVFLHLTTELSVAECCESYWGFDTIFPRKTCSRKKLWEAQALKDQNLRRTQRSAHYNNSLNLMYFFFFGSGWLVVFCCYCYFFKCVFVNPVVVVGTLALLLVCLVCLSVGGYGYLQTIYLLHFQIPGACHQRMMMAFAGLMLRCCDCSLAGWQMAGYVLRGFQRNLGSKGSQEVTTSTLDFSFDFIK